MNIELQNILPVPLKERLLLRDSGVWNKGLLLPQGERIKIKAPSGTGKTTLIHILYKLRGDYEGNILLNKKNLLHIKGTELARLRQQQVSIVFQDLRLFPNLTARENIELVRVLQNPLYESGVIDEMAAQLNVVHVLNQRAGICSYGEQQRIAIIRALVRPFQWLLMDEPFSHLDDDNIKKAGRLISEECNKRNAGFILTDLEDDVHFDYSRKMNL